MGGFWPAYSVLVAHIFYCFLVVVLRWCVIATSVSVVGRGFEAMGRLCCCVISRSVGVSGFLTSVTARIRRRYLPSCVWGGRSHRSGVRRT